MKHYVDYRKLKGWDEFGLLSPIQNAFYKKLFSLAKKFTGRTENILDIGFGNGSLLSYCKTNFIKFDGIESDLKSLNIAKQYFQNVYSLAEFKPEKQYDLIFLLDVLEHNTFEDCNDLLSMCKGLLAKNGLIVIKVPNGDSPFGLRNQNGDPTHISFFGINKLYFFSKILDFKIVFFCGDLEPIFCGSRMHTFHRIIFKPIKLLVNFIINIIFYPGNRTEFCSQSLIVFLKKI